MTQRTTTDTTTICPPLTSNHRPYHLHFATIVDVTVKFQYCESENRKIRLIRSIRRLIIFDPFLVILDKQIKNIFFRFCRLYKNLHCAFLFHHWDNFQRPFPDMPCCLYKNLHWHKWHKWHKLSFNTHVYAISATSATSFFCFALSALSALSPSKVQIVQIVQCHFFINLSLYSIIYIVYNTDQLNL